MSQNLLKRISTSIILLSLLLFANFSHQYIFILSILIVSLIIYFELNNIFLKIIVSQLKKKINFEYLALNLLSFCYIFFIFCYFCYEIHRLEGPVFFLYVVSICFFTDIGGYIIGKTIGGKKLSIISPNKTISGSLGSFVFSIIPLFMFMNFSNLDLKFNFYLIIFSLLISLISQIGDLFISYLKRKAKIKDTGKILPGHGGVLDRLDGIIFAVPFSYFLLKLS